MLKKYLLSLMIVGFNNHMSAYPVLQDVAGKVANEVAQTGLIVAGGTLGAMTYGILNDQVTARICLEYFTQGFHKSSLSWWNGPVLGRLRSTLEKHENSPTIVASIWGPVATIGVGLPLGILAAAAARMPLGNALQFTINELKYPLLGAMAFTGVGALIGGVKRYLEVRNRDSKEFIGLGYNYGVSNDQLKKFEICSGAHHAAYIAGPVAGVGLFWWTLNQRALRI